MGVCKMFLGQIISGKCKCKQRHAFSQPQVLVTVELVSMEHAQRKVMGSEGGPGLGFGPPWNLGPAPVFQLDFPAKYVSHRKALWTL